MLFARSLLALAALAALQFAPGAPPKVGFIAHGPVGMKIEGASGQLALGGDADTLSLSLPVATLQTGIELRDKHMLVMLQSETYPTATLSVKRALIPHVPGDSSADIPAALTLHGQTRPVVIHCHLRQAEALDITATFALELTDYGIEPPSYLGVKVKPSVELSASVRLQDAAADIAK